MNLRNVALEMPMRSSRTDSHVASIRLRFERIREQVGFCRRSDASRIGRASQHESEDAHTQSARPSEHVDSTANLTCLSAAGTRVQTDGGQLRMKLFANSCSDRYLSGALDDVTCCVPVLSGCLADSLFYAKPRSFRAVQRVVSRLESHANPYIHRIFYVVTLGSFCWLCRWQPPQHRRNEGSAHRIPQIR
jgi:hypothetical protein